MGESNLLDKPLRITFITGHLCKERHALLNELALDLGEYGAKVTVITGFPSRRISKEVRDYYLNHPVEQISENVIVKRFGSKRGEGKGLFDRMIKYFFLTKKLYKEAKKTPTDVYYLYSTPFFLGYIGKKLRKTAPTVYNAQDLFPDTLAHTKKMSEKNPLIKYFRRKERAVYQSNTRIITISQEMKKTIIANGGCPDSIDVIYNWADTESLHHVDKKENTLFDEFNISRNDFIISYAGDLGLFQGWDCILDAAKLINKENSSIKFVLIGNGSYKQTILDRVEKENILNVSVLPFQPASRLSEVYSLGDIELLPIEKGLTKMALPSKNGVIMATGSPVLAIVDSYSDIHDIVQDNSIGYCVEPGNLDSLVSTIKKAFDNAKQLKDFGSNARHFAIENYSRKEQTKKYYKQMKETAYGQL